MYVCVCVCEDNSSGFSVCVCVLQHGSLTFNKGRIMNAAFKEALKMYDFQCVVFHDVDLIPEDDRNMYSCPVMPRHMSVAIDEMNYR